jgi:hypothetical protein
MARLEVRSILMVFLGALALCSLGFIGGLRTLLMCSIQGTFGCTGAAAVIQRYDTSRQRLLQLEQLRGDLETRLSPIPSNFIRRSVLFMCCFRTEALSKRRDDLESLLNGLRMGIVSSSSEESRHGIDEDVQELARFSKDLHDMPVRLSPHDQRLAAASATIGRLQPVVARFDTLFLQVVRVICFCVWS